jgi:hypothetical protein
LFAVLITGITIVVVGCRDPTCLGIFWWVPTSS